MDFSDACVIWAVEYPKAIIADEAQRSASHNAAGRWSSALRPIVGAVGWSHGAVQIGGQRDGVATMGPDSEIWHPYPDIPGNATSTRPISR